ncbi:MAG: hypothetical protein ACI840_001989, partial [Ulvibacter sp.]
RYVIGGHPRVRVIGGHPGVRVIGGHPRATPPFKLRCISFDTKFLSNFSIFVFCFLSFILIKFYVKK